MEGSQDQLFGVAFEASTWAPESTESPDRTLSQAFTWPYWPQDGYQNLPKGP